MVLIIGGAWQGKLEFAKREFHLKDSDIYTCSGAEIDFSKPCIDRLEVFTETRTDALSFFQAHRAEWEDAILICQDIFCGVVPVDGHARAWRQDTGRLCQYLASEASRVSRIFCGLEHRLK